MTHPRASLRQQLGCWLHERAQAELVLLAPGSGRRTKRSWLDLCNRRERLRTDPCSGGRRCEWADSSALTVVKVFPDVGARVMRRALEEWPLAFEPWSAREPTSDPDVSILIPVGGAEREDQFRLTLAAARGQVGANCELVVVEQSPTPTWRDRLPTDVRYVHQSLSAGGFNKSRALNGAAFEARGEILLLLDGDLIVPTRYAAECLRVLRRVDAARPARFIFYLDRESTMRAAASGGLENAVRLESIMANTPMPLAVRASTYREIGGHDESYVGWGGEDSEFLDRLRTRSVCEAGWLPVVHAWHAAASGKQGARNREHHRRRMSLSADARISELLARANESRQ